MHSILDSILGSIFCRFLLPTSTPESQLNVSRLAFSWFSAFKLDTNFGSHFDTNLVPSSYPKYTKIHSKTIPRGTKNMIDFGMNLLVILAHVGHFFAQGGGPCGRPPSFLLRCFFSSFFFEFWSPRADGVPHFWPPGPIGYPTFG